MSDSVGEGLPGMRPGLMDRLARPFVVLNERYAPDPFVFVVGLTLVAFVAAVSETETSPINGVFVWGQGLASLMVFTAQLAITWMSARVRAGRQ